MDSEGNQPLNSDRCRVRRGIPQELWTAIILPRLEMTIIYNGRTQEPSFVRNK
jgi:hypothetical protein